MTFPRKVSFPSNVSFPSRAYYPGAFIPPTPNPTPDPVPVPTPTPNPTPTPTITYHPDTLAWRDRVNIAGGSVSEAHLVALDDFVEGIYDLGLRDRNGNNHTILDLMPFMGSNLNAALTKLWHIPSAPNVVNNNFVSSDYTNETGITTNAGKFLDSGIVASQDLNINSVSLGIYNLDSVLSQGSDFIADITQDGNQRLILSNPWSDQDIFFDLGNAFSGRTVASFYGNNIGLTVASRESGRSIIYKRGILIAESTRFGGQLPFTTLKLLICSSPKSYGLLFIAKGIPSVKQSALNILISNLMYAIGRQVPAPIITYHSDTIDWRNRALNNGGIVSELDVKAVDEFVVNAYITGFRDTNNLNHVVQECLPFAGGNLAAALTKLWYPYEAAKTVTNLNFTEADYSRRTGLTGNGTSKTLDSNTILSNFANRSSFSCGLYNRTPGPSVSVEIGVDSDVINFKQRLLFHTHYFVQDYANGAIIDIFDEQNRILVDVSTTQQNNNLIYYSRSSDNLAHVISKNNIVGTDPTSSVGTLPTIPVMYFGRNTPTGPISRDTSARSLGFVFMGQSIPSNLATEFYTSVDKLMAAFGRNV